MYTLSFTLICDVNWQGLTISKCVLLLTFDVSRNIRKVSLKVKFCLHIFRLSYFFLCHKHLVHKVPFVPIYGIKYRNFGKVNIASNMPLRTLQVELCSLGESAKTVEYNCCLTIS